MSDGDAIATVTAEELLPPDAEAPEGASRAGRVGYVGRAPVPTRPMPTRWTIRWTAGRWMAGMRTAATTMVAPMR